MLILLSPAKTLDYVSPIVGSGYTKPSFIKRSADLMTYLKILSSADLGRLMKISAGLADLNAERYRDWSPIHSLKTARPAIFAFDGDVYDGLNAKSMPPSQIDYLQKHLRILSGLYGVLRPLDLMQPYRLEMGTRLANEHGNNLYDFWGDTVSENLLEALVSHRDKTIVNLASEEYFKAVKPEVLQAQIITPIFEDWKNGKYKVISFFAKNARGAMAKYAALHGIKKPELLKQFDTGGYRFDIDASDTRTWRFRRRLED